MELFIRIKDGQPFEHPIFGDNFRQAFPSIDVNNLPPEFSRFERLDPPVLGVYELMASEQSTYEKINDVWTDVWHIRNMTTEEKTAKQQTVITEFNNREYASNWSAWALDEATCTMMPPIPRPALDQTKIDASIYTYWCGADNNWKETPVRPEGEYKFNYSAWDWIAL